MRLKVDRRIFSLLSLLYIATIVLGVGVSASEFEADKLMIKAPRELHIGTTEDSPLWLAYGPITQYPAEGGVWQYGFWNAKVRSYYTMDKAHGSSVIINGDKVTSIKTAPGKMSIAEKWAIQLPGHNDEYYYHVYE